MLYNLDWLQENKPFPPYEERERIKRYRQNIKIFEDDHWALENDIYRDAAARISRVVENFDSYISFPVLYNYQKLIALKTADLAVGEFPNILYSNEEGNSVIDEIRYDTDFDNNIYATIVDLSRFGDAVWRKYRTEDGSRNTYCNWMPTEWFPIVSQDGTFTELAHVLAWVSRTGEIPEEYKYTLNAQVHFRGYYDTYRFNFTPIICEDNSYVLMGTIGERLGEVVRTRTGFKDNAVVHLRPYKVTGTVYGQDDFTPIDSLVLELMTRMSQISNILDRHADPSLTGPISMLSKDENGELFFKKGKFYATAPGEEAPHYLTWDGQLDAAFKQCAEIINQLYILSEMGAALLGANTGGSQAISGNALRLKMVSPLAKVRRISNNLTKPVTALFADLSTFGYPAKLDRRQISVTWKDGLPDDPREQAELVRLLTGETQIMPLRKALRQHFNLPPDEADNWIEELSQTTTAVEESEEGGRMKKTSLLEPHQTGTNSQEEGEFRT